MFMHVHVPGIMLRLTVSQPYCVSAILCASVRVDGGTCHDAGAH